MPIYTVGGSTGSSSTSGPVTYYAPFPANALFLTASTPQADNGATLLSVTAKRLIVDIDFTQSAATGINIALSWGGATTSTALSVVEGPSTTAGVRASNANLNNGGTSISTGSTSFPANARIQARFLLAFATSQSLTLLATYTAGASSTVTWRTLSATILEA